MVTAGTYLKEHHLRNRQRLDFLLQSLLDVTTRFDWQLEAWAVFSNHYHFVAQSPRGIDGATCLEAMLRQLHEETAKWVNRIDRVHGRRVWFNYWDTRLTFETSYLARLNYAHQNPVRHRLVRTAAAFPWCSAAWFERVARPAMLKTVFRMKTDRLRVFDEFDPVLED